MKRLAVLFAVALVVRIDFHGAHAQAPDQKPPAFEVASVKPNTSGQVAGSQAFQPGGRFTATNAPLENVIATAFGISGRSLPTYQIVGAPDWAMSERFDIVAKSVDSDRQDATAIRTLLRGLLADRFHLRTHMETRQLPIYALVRLSSALGTHVRPSDCTGFDGIDRGPGALRAGCVTMRVLADALAGEVGRAVLDRTGITGHFDAELQWTPDQAAADVGTLPNAPSIFTAVQEQLGLKLESTKGPVEVLVIDHIEKPMPD